MASFWDQGPSQDFNLGGFQPANDRVPVPGWTGGPITTGQPQPPGSFQDIQNSQLLGQTQTPSDPRLTTQPQPSQQGPGGTMLPPAIAMGPNGPIDPGTGQPYQQGPGMTLKDVLQGRLQQIQQQHPAGSMGGNIIQALSSPKFQAFMQSRRQTAQTPQMQAVGQVAGQIGSWMQGRPFNPTLPQPSDPRMQTMGSTLGQGLQSAIPAAGSPSQPPQQPMNPSQQSQVPMQSPDGQHFQYVNAEHVPHYQGLGATIANGSSYGSQSGGF